MTFAAEGLAIRSRIAALWTDTSIAWPNRPFSPATGTAYLRVTIRNGDSLQPYLGKTSQRRSVGVVIGDVFAPSVKADNSGMGDNAARVLADSFAAMFRNSEHDGIVYREPSAREAALQEEPWYRWIVEVPYYRDWTPGGISEVAVYGNYYVEQAGHGLVVGDWIKGVSGTFSEAQADAEANLSWPGVVVEADSGSFRFAALGKANLPAHGFGAAGTKIFLSQGTAGAATTSEPGSGWVQQVAKVIDADHVDVQTWPVVNKG